MNSQNIKASINSLDNKFTVCKNLFKEKGGYFT